MDSHPPPLTIDFHVHMLDDDTRVYDPQVLKVLIERIGADRMVMGSDYPVGEKHPVGFLRANARYAARLLGIVVEQVGQVDHVGGRLQ